LKKVWLVTNKFATLQRIKFKGL